MTVSVQNLEFTYGTHPVLKDVSFTAQTGEVLAVLGPNGAGKSTLFRCILRLLAPQGGTVKIGGTDTAGMHPKELAGIVAYVPQSHYPAFNFSVTDMVLMGTTVHVPDFSMPGREQMRTAAEAMERIGISHLKDRAYMELSGGEQQLVLIARALAQEAKVLVMDEPTASLDYGNQQRILRRIRALAQEGYAVLQSMHNPDQAFLYADKVLALSDGCVRAFGRPKDVIEEKLIRELYQIEAQVESLHEDRFRVCLPKDGL